MTLREATASRGRRRLAAPSLLLALALTGCVPSAPTPTFVPSQPTPTASPTPTRGAPGQRWVSIAAPAGEEQLGVRLDVGETPYFLLGRHAATDGTQECGRIDVRRYLAATDEWEALSPLSRKHDSCGDQYSYVHGEDIYLVVRQVPMSDGGRGPMELYRYRTAKDTWESLPQLDERDPYYPVPTETGIVFDRGWTTDYTGDYIYRYFDYKTGEWTRGKVPFGKPLPHPSTGRYGSVSVRPVTVDGRPLVLLIQRERDVDESATEVETNLVQRLAVLDPGTGELSHQTSHKLPEVITGARSRVTRSGVVFLGPENWPWVSPDQPTFLEDGPLLRVGLFVDLAADKWWQLEIPRQAGPTDVTSDAAWTLTYYPEETAEMLVVNGYLYEPATGDWFAVPPLPTADGVDLADEVGKVPDARLTCKASSAVPWGCWRLVSPALDKVLVPVSEADIAATNATVR